MSKTLIEAMPREFNGGEYIDTRAFKLRDKVVTSEHGATTNSNYRWPGKEKNVFFWVILQNGYAVGWNENPSRGWSFPVIKLTPSEIAAYQGAA